MTYLNCPRCHLAILAPMTRLAADDCPRCLGREGIHTTLFASTLPYRELAESGSAEPLARTRSLIHDRTGLFAGRSSFDIRLRRAGSRIVMELFGELDLANAASFEQRLAEARQSPATHVVIDLSRLDFIDSTGLNALVRACRRGDVRLSLLRGSDAVHRPFELTGLDAVLPFAQPTSL